MCYSHCLNIHLAKENALLIRTYKLRVNQDMRFASMCGFKKLLVGTGSDSLEEAQKDIDGYPDYYLPALSQLFSTHKDI